MTMSTNDRTIIAMDVHDVRFPTSEHQDGSDAMFPDPDYSAAYVVLRTDASDGVEGHGLTFTIGRLGTAEECADAALWLVSGEASFVTGVALPVDGGFTAM